MSLYGATKKANELMAHSYAHLFGLPVTGLRFFTVYGPWGRPDMSLFLFTRDILAGQPIKVFNYGHHARDFTYIDDAVEGVVRALDTIATPDPDWRRGSAGSRHLVGAVSALQYRQSLAPSRCSTISPRSKRRWARRPSSSSCRNSPATCEETYADVEALKQATDFSRERRSEQGIERFVAWYRDYYQV